MPIFIFFFYIYILYMYVRIYIYSYIYSETTQNHLYTDIQILFTDQMLLF